MRLPPHVRSQVDRMKDYRERMEQARELLRDPLDRERILRARVLLEVRTASEKAEERERQGELSINMLLGAQCYRCEFIRSHGWTVRRRLDEYRHSEACPKCGHGAAREVELCGRVYRIDGAQAACKAQYPCPTHGGSHA